MFSLWEFWLDDTGDDVGSGDVCMGTGDGALYSGCRGRVERLAGRSLSVIDLGELESLNGEAPPVTAKLGRCSW